MCLICNANSFFLRGEQTVKLTVTKGGPLPFAWDILSPQTQYGSIPFTKYPEDIPDYVKQSFPEGCPWERIIVQEYSSRPLKQSILLKVF